MTYRKEELLARLQLLSGDMTKLYQDPCINYRGRTADTGEYDTEVIAAYLLEHLDLFEKIETISRTSSYRVGGHDGPPSTRTPAGRRSSSRWRCFARRRCRRSARSLTIRSP